MIVPVEMYFVENEFDGFKKEEKFEKPIRSAK